MNSTRSTPTVMDVPHAEAIDAQTVFAQIGQPTMLRVGAVDLMFSADYVQFDMTMGRAKRRVVIVLAGDDTYSVEVGRTVKPAYAWRSIAVHHGIYGDRLSDVVDSMFAESFA
jgi:hypothetical protein